MPLGKFYLFIIILYNLFIIVKFYLYFINLNILIYILFIHIYRLNLFRKQLNILKSDGTDSFSIDQIITQINNNLSPDQQFSQNEVQSALQVMSDSNQIFYSDGVVYIV